MLISPRRSENTGFPLETLYARLWDSGLSGRFREPGQTDFRQTESSDRTCLESINARRRSSEPLSSLEFLLGLVESCKNGRLNENARGKERHGGMPRVFD